MIPFENVDTVAIRLWLDGTALHDVTAVRVHCATEQEWLTARLDGIGASEVAPIAGMTSWTSPYALWWRKKLDWRLPRTEQQRWGHLVEEPIAELFAEEMAADLYVAWPVGAPYSLWCHPVRGWMLCTPDRLAVDRGGHIYPVEIKSDEGGKGWGASGTDEVPDAYRAQVSWQAFIFGAPGGYVARRKGSGKGRLAWYYVPLDEEWLNGLADRACAFLMTLDADTPPEPDGSRATTETLQQINPAIDAGQTALVSLRLWAEWHDARQAKRDAAAREALASNLLRQEMGRAEFATRPGYGGVEVVFAKRRIGKRSGYEVGPGMTDELREIGGERDEGAGVRPEPDGPAAAASVQEGPGDGGGPGAELGDGEGGGAGQEDPGGDALSLGEQPHDPAGCHNLGLPHLGPCVDATLNDSWPYELIEGDVTAADGQPVAVDSGRGYPVTDRRRFVLPPELAVLHRAALEAEGTIDSGEERERADAGTLPPCRAGECVYGAEAGLRHCATCALPKEDTK